MQDNKILKSKKILFKLLIFTVIFIWVNVSASAVTAISFISSIDITKSETLKKMYENAIDIPNSAENRNTAKKVEQPPKDRSKELQIKIVPLSVNGEIPEPFEYFKNIIFLGDSVTTGFNLFKSRITFNGEKVLKDVTVVASGSYGVYNASKAISNKSIHPLYDGKQTLPEDIIAKKDGKIVLICLGLNDVSWMSTEQYIKYYGNLIYRIKDKSPDKTVVIMSVTPVVDGSNKNLTNDKVMKANNALIEYADKNDIPFMDYGAAIRESNNDLSKDLASDGYCHLTIEAYNRLVEYILYHPINIQ